MQEWYRRRDITQQSDAQLSLQNQGRRAFLSSAKVFQKFTCLHPEFAFGFHWLSRIRAGAFSVWPLLAKLDGLKQHLASNNAGAQCPCCGRDATDSLGHFLFFCGTLSKDGTGERLHALRTAKVNALGRLIAKDGDHDAGRNGGKLIGAATLLHRIFRANTGQRVTRPRLDDDFVYFLLGARVPTGPGNQPKGLHDIENWSPESDEEKKLVELVLGKQALAGKGRPTQKRYRLYELGLVICARYLDSAMSLRNATFWKKRLKPPRSVGTTARKSKPHTSGMAGVS